MKTPKTLVLIECRRCNGCYYGGTVKLVLHPGTESEQPDEISIIVRKIGKCATCKVGDDRTKGGRNTRYEY